MLTVCSLLTGFHFTKSEGLWLKQDMSWIYMNNEPITECQDAWINADLLDEI